MGTRSRPAQGNNSGPLRRPRPAYAPDNGTPKLVSQGSVSRPKPKPHGKPKTLTQDATPRIVTL